MTVIASSTKTPAVSHTSTTTHPTMLGQHSAQDTQSAFRGFRGVGSRDALYSVQLFTLYGALYSVHIIWGLRPCIVFTLYEAWGPVQCSADHIIWGPVYYSGQLFTLYGALYSVHNIWGPVQWELSQKYRSTDNRRNQKQESAKIGTHSQEEPFLGSHKPKPGSPKIGRKKVGSTNYRKNINRRHRKRKK